MSLKIALSSEHKKSGLSTKVSKAGLAQTLESTEMLLRETADFSAAVCLILMGVYLAMREKRRLGNLICIK